MPSSRIAAPAQAEHFSGGGYQLLEPPWEDGVVYLIGGEREMGQYPSERFRNGDPRRIKVEGPETEEMLRAIALQHRHQYNLGFRITDDDVPTLWEWNSSRPVPDYYTPHGFPCVSSRFKEVVEGLEPDVHQFFPVTVVNKAGDEIAQRWLWVVCNRIDGVDREHTTMVLRKGTYWTSNWREGNERVTIPGAKLYHSKKQTAGHHFWRDKHLIGGGIQASDEAAEALIALDLVAFAASKLETV